MRRTLIRLLPLALAAAMAVPAVPASAGGPYRDRIYADSFGNLVVHSRAGYKRIVVGAGHLAAQLNDYERSGVMADDVVMFEEEQDGQAEAQRGCWHPAVLLKGRSYMYGLADGELPDLPGKHCD